MVDVVIVKMCVCNACVLYVFAHVYIYMEQFTGDFIPKQKDIHTTINNV